MEHPLVYCVILNLNGRILLLETLQSVKQLAYQNFRIIVVDNGSTDGSQEAVRASYPEIILIENERNLGFGEGNNVGIRYALARNAEWVFLLNNDISVDPQLLTALIKAGASDKTIGILGPKIYYHAEPDRIWYAGGKINYFTGIISHRGIREKERGQFGRIEETDFVTGCALLVRREAIESIGMFDPAYFPIYTEDVDLCVRAKRAGYRSVFVPTGKLWHKVSAFSGGGLTPFKTRLKVEHNLIFFKRYARWHHWLTIPWCVGGAAIVFMMKELLKGNFGIVLSLGQGFVKAVAKIRS